MDFKTFLTAISTIAASMRAFSLSVDLHLYGDSMKWPDGYEITTADKIEICKKWVNHSIEALGKTGTGNFTDDQYLDLYQKVAAEQEDLTADFVAPSTEDELNEDLEESDDSPESLFGGEVNVESEDRAAL